MTKINEISPYNGSSPTPWKHKEHTLAQKEQAAIKIQSVLRRYLAQSKLNTLRIEKAEVFSPHSTSLTFPDRHRELRDIHGFDDIEAMLKTVCGHVQSNHTVMDLSFGSIPRSEIETRMRNYQKSPLSEGLLFNILKWGNDILTIQAKPSKIEDMGDGKTRMTFVNGVVEELTLDNNNSHYYGVRHFPDGSKQQGEFHRVSKEFMSGYRKSPDGLIEFFDPKPLVSYGKQIILEVEEKLVVLIATFKDRQFIYEIADIPVEKVLLKASLRVKNEGSFRANILSHKDFKERLDLYINHALSLDDSGSPRIFGFTNLAIKYLIEMGAKNKAFDPLKIIDPLTRRNLFTQAAHWGSVDIMAKLIELFPQAYLTIAQDVIAEFLHQGHPAGYLEKFISELERLGGKLDTYHTMLVDIAKGKKPNDQFEKELVTLPIPQKSALYEAAFAYNNPFIHEPPDLPVTADQYSVNLMWINDMKMPADKEYLCGNSSKSFQKAFVVPVSKWAKANPGSQINIWIDGEMATSSAIERSRYTLEKALEGTSHGTVVFRDVRSIELVCANPQVFSEEMPIYFRVDLLRAIAADHTLRNKETQYFMYGDIDMTPLSRQELFDKKTLSFLNDFGFVMAKGGTLGFENGFQILNGENLQFMHSHRKVIVDLSLDMALKSPSIIDEQQIYDTYPAMITHLLAADGRYGKLKGSQFRYLLGKSKYDKCFRYDIFGTSAHKKLPLSNKKILLNDIMPQKPVHLPPSHFL